MQLKKELLDKAIWVPFINQNIVGRFIPENLLPHMYKKYPELFEIAEIKLNKEKKSTNAISISDTINGQSSRFSDDNKAE